MNDLFIKLSSRKFLLAVGTAVTLLAAKRYTEAAGIAAAYVLGEAAIDRAAVVKAGREVLDTLEGVKS